jgi:hypothetical protein
MIIVLSVAGFVALVTVALIHRDRPASITGFSWERSIDIYNEHWVQRSSYWPPPAESRNHHSKTVHTTRTVTRLVPTTEYISGKWQTVYKPRTDWGVPETKTLHTYEVPKRRYSHTVRESGASRDGVAWPKATGHVGARKQRYTVEFVGLDGKHHTTNVSEKRWRTLDEDTAYLLSVTWYGSVLRIRTEHA